MARVNVYVDGFNLYYGAVKDRPEHKWLDIAALAANLLKPTDVVNEIRYFTAKIATRGDPQAPQRQQTYLRALETIPNLSIEYGRFMTQKRRKKLVSPRRGKKTAEVFVTEEKGSDVNLASWLLWDALQGSASSVSLVISGDTDLVRPIEMLTQRLDRRVGVVDGTIDRQPSNELLKVASWVKKLRVGAIAAAQFPTEMTDSKGTFRRPAAWDPPAAP